MLLNHQQSFKELDALLEAIRTIFVLLIQRESLKEESIEKWRWDYPVITLTWVADRMNRNINVLAGYSQENGYLSTTPEPIIEVVEVNVWKDVDESEGIRVRNWRHEVIVRKAKAGRVQDRLELIERSIQLAYKEASHITDDQLDRKTIIASENTAFY
jgi:hypothetical protein